MPKSECKSHKNDLHKYCYSSVYILWNCKSSRTSLEKLDQIHERAVGIITKTNPVKLTPIMNYVKRHACQIARTSITRQLPSPMTISNYYHTQSQQETINSR